MTHARELAARLSLPAFTPTETLLTTTDDEKKTAGTYARFILGTRSAHGARGSEDHRLH